MRDVRPVSMDSSHGIRGVADSALIAVASHKKSRPCDGFFVGAIYRATSTLRGRPPFLPLARAASAFAALLWRPLREEMTEAAMFIRGLLAEIIPAMETCRSFSSWQSAVPEKPKIGRASC